MVKPQFEVGRERLGSGGVVRQPSLWVDAVVGVARAAAGLGLAVRDVVRSPLPGPSGNIEFFLWLARPDGADGDHLEVPVERIARAVQDEKGVSR
jgi:23S rRNA (cytidine1920-2'-O)/16S rRNA (cytidine1409-2'-O)-methyltransferase